MLSKIKDHIKKYFKYSYFFYRYLKFKMLLLVLFSFFVGVLDSLGIVTFIPLFELATQSKEAIEQNKNGATAYFYQAMNYMNIEVNITNLLIIMLMFFSLKGVFKFLNTYTRVFLQKIFVKKLRFFLVNNIATLNYERFVKSDLGKMQNLISTEITRVINSFNMYFGAAQSLILATVYFVTAAKAEPSSIWMVVIGGICIHLLIKSIYKISIRLSNRITGNNGEFHGLIIQKLLNFKYLKATSRMHIFGVKLKKIITAIENDQEKLGFNNALLTGLKEPLGVLIVVIIIYFQVVVSGKPFNSIILGIFLLYRAFGSMTAIQVSWNSFLNNVGAIDTFEAFKIELAENKEVQTPKIFEGFDRDIKINDLSFAYSETNVLSNINLTIPKYHTVAFVGESGSGKTTLINLLAGLLHPRNGSITLDNQSLKEYNLDSYRNRIGYITQESVVFNDSIFNNITFWDEKNEKNMERFNYAIKKASLYDFVQKSKDKEDTFLGDNGMLISGGQKQRLSIARELYKSCDILILDEATSALDSETEKEIQESFEALKGEITILIIAHRLSTIKNANNIVVMKDGVIDSQGTFKELVVQSPLFAKMVELQEMK